MAKINTLGRTSVYSDLLAEKYRRFREQQKYIDCHIVVQRQTGEEERICCHAIIISSISPLMDDMLQTPMTESRTRELPFPLIPANIMTLIVEYMYTGKLTVREEEVGDLLRATDYLRIKEIPEWLRREADKVITPNNALEVMWLSEQLSMQDIKQSTHKVIKTSFKEVIMSDEFLVTKVEQIKYILNDAELLRGVASDDRLLAVLRWFSAEQNKKFVEALDIIKLYIRNCPLRTLKTVTEQYPVPFAEHAELLTLVDEALKEKDKSPMQPSIAEKLPMVIVDREHNSMYQLNDGNLKALPPYPDYFLGAGAGACKYEGVGLIVTGGTLSGNSWAVYNVRTASWEKGCPALTCHRHSHVAVCINEQLFLFGGVLSRDQSEHAAFSDSVESLTLDLVNAEWQKEQQVPEELCYIKLAYLDTDVYVMGDKCPRLYCFDVVRRAWCQKGEMQNDPMEGFSLAAGNGVIFAVGEDLASVYSLSADQWTTISRPLKRHSNGALVFHEGKLFLCRGGIPTDVEMYDIEQNQWTTQWNFFIPTTMKKHLLALSMADCRRG